MTQKRILTISLVAAVASVILVNVYVAQVRGEYTGNAVVVLQATHDVAEGKPVAPGDYKEVPLPRKLFETVTSYAVTKDDLPILASTPLRRALKTGDIISYSHLSRTVQEGLRDTIAPGKRAVAIQVTEETSVSNFVQPGDIVDIISTLATKEKAVTRPLLTGVRVLAVGGEYGATAQTLAQRGKYATVTVETTVEEAERLIFAREQLRATMTLLLRNPKDQGDMPSTPVINGNDLLSTEAK